MTETDALSAAKIGGGGLFVSDFPAKLRILTLDPMVYNSSYQGTVSTKYAFIVYNLDTDQVQILNKGPSFAKRFQEIHGDQDFGANLREIDLKVTTNGKEGTKEVRYTVTPIGSPKKLTQEQLKVVKEANVDLEAIIKKNNPGAIRLSEANAGTEIPDSEETSSSTADEEVTIEDLGETINLDDIPF